jgi:DNA-binding CsgD family transcriptional regulator/tetratricopeptide (TPR) repeat protein
MPIGRDAEAARISGFLREVPRGPRVLLIEGEAGIGKTTLLKEGHDTAVRLGITVLFAYPVESEVPLEFAGLADLLEAVPAVLIDGLPGPQRQAVRQAVFRTESMQRPADPRTTATAVLTLLRNLSGLHPVVVVVDDLAWLDTASARALSFALRRLRLEPVGLLAAVRTDWSGIPPLLAADSVPADRVDRQRLGPLSLGAIRELLATRTTLSPGRSLLLRLHEASGGNPLFALELAARAQAGISPAWHDTLDVPDSLRRLVLGRITGLAPGPRDVLLVSSLSAEPALAVICAASRDPATAHADLEAGIRTGLLAMTDGGVAFVHPLMRSAVAEQAPAADRRAAHRRLAAAVCGTGARARHLALGAAGPDEAVAGEVEAAARMAARRGACDAAADLAELAVTLTPLAEADSQRRRTVLAAEERFEASDPARACCLLEDIIDAVPAGPARAELLRRAARYRAFRGEPMVAWGAALGRALDEAGDDTAVRAVIMLDQAVAASLAGDLRGAIRTAEAILELAGQAGDPALEAQCCAGLAVATFAFGDGLRPDLIERALAGPRQSSRLSMDLRPDVAIGHLLHWTGDLDRARVLYEQEYARAMEDGAGTGLPFLLWAMAENEGWAGNWPQAEQLAAEGYRLAEDSGSPAAIAFMSAARGVLHAYRGRIDAALRDAARAAELAGRLGMPLPAAMAAQAFGIAALSAGDAAGAHQRLGPLAAAVLAVGVAEPALCRFVPDEVEALTRLGELAAAEALLGPFEARSALAGQGWGIATARRCRGLLLAARGDLASAATALDIALGAHQRLAMPFEEARTLLAAGEVHRRARHKQQALNSLQAALVIFERLGAPRWRDRVLGELARVGTRATPRGAGPVLTAAEQSVADLVAAGHTNAEVAAGLFMGQRTVEAHLSRVYRKLSVQSRKELGRVLTPPAP